MKKLFFAFLLLSLFNSFVFAADNSDKINSSMNNDDSLKSTVTYNKYKKDPKLIKITNTKPVSKDSYNKKLASDNTIYSTYKKQLVDEQKELYVILDKLIRANKLQFQNWRVGVQAETEDINASAGSANLIYINSSLYDSLYNNKDALAFVVAHELSHLILKHGKTSYENYYKIKQLEEQISRYQAGARYENAMGRMDSALGNYGSSAGSAVVSTAYLISGAVANANVKKLYEENRKLEYEADSEALTLMTRAGYNPYRANDSMEFLSALPGVYTEKSSHPETQQRISAINTEISLLDIDELKNQGMNNIYNSKPLKIRKSSDKKTFVIVGEGSLKNNYVYDTKENKYIKKAYVEYLNNQFTDAKLNFVNAVVINPKNDIPCLYLSYISELEYHNNDNKKSLKHARRWAKKSLKNNPDNKYAQKQLDDINKIMENLKAEAKNEDK